MSAKRKLQRPRNYFSRAEQYRLLAIVFAVGATFIVGNHVWKNFAAERSSATSAGLNTEINTRLSTSAPAGEFPSVVLAEPRRTSSAAERAKYFPGVDPTLLDTIQDDTVWRSGEFDAWFHLLQLLDQTQQEELEASSERSITFAQLYQQPRAYRGQLMTVRGTVYQAFTVKPATNNFGIDNYTQIWLRPTDTDSLVVAYCIDIPADFPLGRDLREPVELTGFFFKRWAYAAQDGLRTAPLLLAKRLSSEANPNTSTPGVRWLQWVVVATLAGTLVVAVLFARQNRQVLTGRPKYQQGPDKLHELDACDIEGNIHDSLRRLAEDGKP